MATTPQMMADDDAMMVDVPLPPPPPPKIHSPTYELEHENALSRLSFDLYLQERIALEAEASYYDALRPLLMEQQQQQQQQQRQLPYAQVDAHARGAPQQYAGQQLLAQHSKPTSMPLSPLRSSTNMMSMLSGKRSTESDIYAFNNAKRQRGTATLDLDADML